MKLNSENRRYADYGNHGYADSENLRRKLNSENQRYSDFENQRYSDFENPRTISTPNLAKNNHTHNTKLSTIHDAYILCV
jgi:hypothetical protein